ncbi:C2 family cysteine protease [Bacillus paramycoides]|uniref:C2 family cysteine protease n=1 Tax=Bacillus paramycoides TaxID=2026194 RepID=UPI002E2315BD|nr:C2 family cysteine protease [Bacillus paramycoides]MED1105000.1 C2 family cysteine protease [Bacillus paramycoides]
MSKYQKETPKINTIGGASNPFAIAELILGRKIDWESIENKKEILEATVGKECDPFSPIYNIENFLKALGDPWGTGDGNPPNWEYVGEFFVGAPEVTDVIQRIEPDCAFMAALASVVWARPFVIAKKTKATDNKVDLIEFYDQANNVWVTVEVTEKLPVDPKHRLIYAQSRDKGGIWACVYEKAYAKWKIPVITDQPDIMELKNLNGVSSIVDLTGLKPTTSFDPQKLTEDEIIATIVSQSFCGKTLNPMVACTFKVDEGSKMCKLYKSVDIIEDHCYSILGWKYVNNQYYIVLRNPWGQNLHSGATSYTANGDWAYYDVDVANPTVPGVWRKITLPNNGIFAFDVKCFKKCFKDFGGAN